MIEKNLTQWEIEYKKIDEEKSVELFKIKSKYHMLYVKSKGNQFMLNEKSNPPATLGRIV